MATQTSTARLALTRRPRRLRRTEAIRSLVRETQLTPDCFILPLFVCEGRGVRREVSSMPGVCPAVGRRGGQGSGGGEGRRRPGRAAVRPARQQGRDRLQGVRSRRAGAERCARAQARGARSDCHHRRLPVRVHVTRALRHSGRRRDSQRRHRRARRRRSALARGGGRRFRRAVRHDGRPRGRHPERCSTSAVSIASASCRTRRSTARRSTVRSATPPIRRRSSAIAAATRWIRPTSRKRCAKSRPTRGRRRHHHGEAGAALSRRDLAREDAVQPADGRVSRQRRVRDAQARRRRAAGSTSAAAMLETLTAIKRAGADIIITYYARDAARIL